MNILRVELGERSYPIYIGKNLLSNSNYYTPYISGDQVMIVSNPTIAPIYLESVTHALAGHTVYTHLMPDGESYKNIETLHSIFDALLEAPCNRQTTLIALGGGVVGDVAGFASACYQRGIGFVQIPTTLLAQVDSSVGGKTGINHPMGKNMIGAFHQPRAVIIDINTLDSLPDREFRAGLAEVIKYGIIRDYEFFEWLESNIQSLLTRDPETLIFAIERSCVNKSKVVEADEREEGLRATLNLGHTFGHAIETATGYSTWLHGEAIAAGMIMAAYLSHLMEYITESDLTRIENLIQQIALPTAPPDSMTSADFLSLMSVDKKIIDARIRLVLLNEIGNAFVDAEYPQHLLNKTLDHFTT